MNITPDQLFSENFFILGWRNPVQRKTIPGFESRSSQVQGL
jgi:hypothetical protein